MANFSNHDGTIKDGFAIGSNEIFDNAGLLRVRDPITTNLAKLQVAAPTVGDDAATKDYVDSSISAGNPSGLDIAKASHVFGDGDTAVDTTSTLLTTGVVLRVTVNVLTAYDVAATFICGLANLAENDAFVATGEIDLQLQGTYFIDLAYTNPLPGATAFQFSIGNSAGVSAGAVDVFYHHIDNPDA